jgi:acylphosphatase
MSSQQESRCVRRFLISGVVQGVFFRASTRQEAERLGLSGYARNLRDGRVEVVAAGPCTKLEALEHWLWEGPPSAQVDEVVSEDYAGAVPGGFSVG